MTRLDRMEEFLRGLAVDLHELSVFNSGAAGRFAAIQDSIGRRCSKFLAELEDERRVEQISRAAGEGRQS